LAAFFWGLAIRSFDQLLCASRRQIQSDPGSEPLFARDGAGIPQDAAKNGKHMAVGSPKSSACESLLPAKNHRGAKFSTGALEVSHRHFRLEYQAARRQARSPDAARSSASISGDAGGSVYTESDREVQNGYSG